MSIRISGTKEWSVASLNFNLGCAHRCRYCYARADATTRFERCTMSEWGTTYNQLKEKPLAGFTKTYPGTVMLPTTHDLTPELLDTAILGLYKLLTRGNEAGLDV
jgi:hypothetical protein